MAEASNYLTLAEAARLLPKRGGKHVSLPTLWRWTRVGVAGVRLRTWRFGRRIATTEAALAEFGEAVARALAPGGTADGGPSPADVEGQPSGGSA